MSEFTCIIVDDEPIARQIVETYIRQYPVLKVIASCENAMDARAELQKHAIDIIFLDINMPVLDGIGFLKTLKKQPQVIFTTAYKEFAVEAFDLSACDYLLKPFSFERFIVAVDKAIERLNRSTGIQDHAPEEQPDDYIFIKADGKMYKVSYGDILCAEASGNFTKVTTRQKQLLPAMTFSNLEEILPEKLFIRVHRSFIINKSKITHIEGNRVFIDQTEIPIGSNYKDDFLKACGL